MYFDYVGKREQVLNIELSLIMVIIVDTFPPGHVSYDT